MPSYGYDGPVTADAWAKMQQALAVDYACLNASSAKVSANTSGCSVAAGTLGGWGVLDVLATPVQVNLTAPGSGTAWWMIVARRNWATSTTTFVAITAGTARPSTLPTRSTTPGTQDDQPLALIGWTAGQSQPTALVDLRTVGMAGEQLIFDTQAMQYLTRAGRRVALGSVDWVCLLSGSTLTWTQVGGSTSGGQVALGVISASRSIPDSSYTRMTSMTLNAHSTAGMMNASTGLVTIPTSGWYTCVANVVWASLSSVTRRIVVIEKGSGTPGTGTFLGREDTNHSGYCGMSVTVEVWLNAGEVVSAVMYSTTSTNIRGDLAPVSFSVRRVS